MENGDARKGETSKERAVFHTNPNGQFDKAGQSSARANVRMTKPTAPVCAICGGTGFVVPDLPPAHPNFGKALACRCRAQERMERSVRVLQRLSSLEPVKRLTFETFIPEPSYLEAEKAFHLRRAYETCVEYAQEPAGWLLLTGTYGCGKTHLAAAIANARLDIGQSALFMVVPDLLDHLRAAFSPHSEVSYDELFEQLRTTPLLILDDLGTQSSTPWAQEKLFQLLNHRYNAQLPTVITTNQRLEDLEPRLRSRLLHIELVSHLAIIAPDFRAGKNPSQGDLGSLNIHQEQRFDNFFVQRNDLSSDGRANLREVFDACRAYASEPQGWLVLNGGNGCGKTHLAAAIANHQVEIGRGDVMFIVVPDLLDYLRAAYSPQATTPYDRRFDEIKKTPILILDDLGTESATPWAKEKLYQLFNYRYNALLSTVITTSSDPKKIEPWLRTRMFDQTRCQYRGIQATAYRGGGTPQPPTRARAVHK